MPIPEPQKSSKEKKRRMRRLPGITDITGQQKRACSICGETGHNKATCESQKAGSQAKKKSASQAKKKKVPPSKPPPPRNDENNC
jgi:hypothetical protein